mgnify:CR=1 FL=1
MVAEAASVAARLHQQRDAAVQQLAVSRAYADRLAKELSDANTKLEEESASNMEYREEVRAVARGNNLEYEKV